MPKGGISPHNLPLPCPPRALSSCTVDADQHVLGRDSPHAAQAGHSEERASQGSSGPVDGEALFTTKEMSVLTDTENKLVVTSGEREEGVTILG